MNFKFKVKHIMNRNTVNLLGRSQSFLPKVVKGTRHFLWCYLFSLTVLTVLVLTTSRRKVSYIQCYDKIMTPFLNVFCNVLGRKV